MPYHLPEEVLAKLVIRQQYDSGAILKNLVNMTGTSLPGVFKMPMFWVMWIFHVILFSVIFALKCPEPSIPPTAENLECVDSVAYLKKTIPLSLGDLGLLNTLTAFFIVFYSGNCFARYTGEPSPRNRQRTCSVDRSP
jgi:hypothetical protein